MALKIIDLFFSDFDKGKCLIGHLSHKDIFFSIEKQILPYGHIGPSVVFRQLEDLHIIHLLPRADNGTHVSSLPIDGKAWRSVVRPCADDVLSLIVGDVLIRDDIQGRFLVLGVVEEGEGEALVAVLWVAEARLGDKIVISKAL